MAGTTPNRWVVRSCVILTALLCLGVAGYSGQVWWARHLVSHDVTITLDTVDHSPAFFTAFSPRVYFRELLQEWRVSPSWGRFRDGRWIPRRTYHELFRLGTGADVANNPDAWEAWFNANPNLVWDEKLKRLVEKP